MNLGSGDYTDDIIINSVSPRHYQKILKSVFVKRPSFIGACCGSNPSHISELRDFSMNEHLNGYNYTQVFCKN